MLPGSSRSIFLDVSEKFCVSDQNKKFSDLVLHSAYYAILIFDCFSMNAKLELYCMFLSCDSREWFRVNPHSIVA